MCTTTNDDVVCAHQTPAARFFRWLFWITLTGAAAMGGSLTLLYFAFESGYVSLAG